MSTGTEQGSSTLPVSLFLLAAIASPYILYQSSLAVFAVVLGINPRGGAGRAGLPWNEVFAIVLTILLAGTFILLLSKKARNLEIGWVVPSVVVGEVILGSLVAAFLVSTTASYFADLAPNSAWVRASEFSQIALLVGAALVSAMLLVAPVAARVTPRRKWIRPTYAALAGILLAYGLVPVSLSLAFFG